MGKKYEDSIFNSEVYTAQQNSQPNIAINSIITKFANNE